MLTEKERIKIYLHQLGYGVASARPDTDFLFLLIESHQKLRESVERQIAREDKFDKRFGWLPVRVQLWLRGD